MRYYRPFRDVIPRSKAGHPRVTHPFATLLAAEAAFASDLHVLGTPPALILSQDQTLMLNSPSQAASRLPGNNFFNARPLLALLRCFGYVKCCGCAPALTDQDTRRLILDGSLCVLARTI